MIHISSQSGTNQYDQNGRAVTYWDAKKCSWIVYPEFEKEEIDWYGSDSDFPAGYTIAEYELNHPGWKKMPDITVNWYWNTKETCIKTFGLPSKFLKTSDPHYFDFWDIQTYPYTAKKYWGDIDEPKESAVARFGKYCDFNKNADKVIVLYNGTVIHDGILK